MSLNSLIHNYQKGAQVSQVNHRANKPLCHILGIIQDGELNKILAKYNLHNKQQ